MLLMVTKILKLTFFQHKIVKILFTPLCVLTGFVMLSGCSNDDYLLSVPKGLSAVDLGLPSGTLWANMNLGAKKIGDLGDYYAWGEREDKTDYSEDSYFHANHQEDTDYDLGNICGSEYDVARALWGNNWQMPTREQISELISQCKRIKWVQFRGNWGYRFVGHNNNTIFIPAAGFRKGTDRSDVGQNGCYWSSMQDSLSVDDAYLLFFNPGEVVVGSSDRYQGLPVRPVTKVHQSY